jgi:HD-GYP domain-containing protein (c-di-GMP phosphodiesterase class II)
MSQETALEELWANAGSQFDPRIVAALAQVIRRGEVPDERSTARAVRSVLVAPHLPANGKLLGLRASDGQ